MPQDTKDDMTEAIEPSRDPLPSGIALTALSRAPLSMVVTNPGLPDNPIVYVNHAFERMTGYSAQAAVGRNCRFLQGDDTDPEDIRTLRDAIAAGQEVALDLKNYRADGRPFWNRLVITPLSTDDGETAYFLGVQVEINEPRKGGGRPTIDVALQEIQHRVKNHLSMIVGMIRLQARQVMGAEEEFRTLARRVETLQMLYEELMDAKTGRARNDDDVALGAYLTRVANAISYIDGRSGVRVNIDADAITVPFETATQIGLVLSEIMTNTLQHAFDSREAGLVEVRIKELSGGVVRLQVSDDGVGIPSGVDWPNDGNLGGRIVSQLVDGLHAKLSVARGATGTIITLDVPSTQAETA